MQGVAPAGAPSAPPNARHRSSRPRLPTRRRSRPCALRPGSFSASRERRRPPRRRRSQRRRRLPERPAGTGSLQRNHPSRMGKEELATGKRSRRAEKPAAVRDGRDVRGGWDRRVGDRLQAPDPSDGLSCHSRSAPVAGSGEKASDHDSNPKLALPQLRPVQHDRDPARRKGEVRVLQMGHEDPAEPGPWGRDRRSDGADPSAGVPVREDGNGRVRQGGYARGG